MTSVPNKLRKHSVLNVAEGLTSPQRVAVALTDGRADVKLLLGKEDISRRGFPLRWAFAVQET